MQYLSGKCLKPITICQAVKNRLASIAWVCVGGWILTKAFFDLTIIIGFITSRKYTVFALPSPMQAGLENTNTSAISKHSEILSDK